MTNDAPILETSVVGGELQTELTEAIEAAEHYLGCQHADSTRRAYRNDWGVFVRFCDKHALQSLPAEPATVVLFLSRQAQTGLKVSTLARRAAAIRMAHRSKGIEPPTGSELVKGVLRGIRREHGSRPEQKLPVLAEQIRAMAVHADPGTLSGVRDRALLLLGFGAALRRSELAALRVEDLEFVEAGLRVHIPRSKTDPEGHGQVVAVTRGSEACPVEAVQAWLRCSAITAGPVFRRVFKDARIGDKALSAQSVALVVKRYAKALGLDPALFAGHSLRAGFLTSAARNGAQLKKMMKISRHRDPKTVMGYIRQAEEFEDHAGDGLL